MKHSDEPVLYTDVDPIRRIQELMVLCAVLPPDGKLREILQLTLALHEEPVLSRMTPVADLHPHAVKAWLESLWLREGLSAEEKEVVAWQNDTHNMGPALQELKEAEHQIGYSLIAQPAT
ncbi:MAG: hypothetical protein QOC93_12 [Actinomycetota bacterium]|jgi:hypothetical protein|nr:Cinorf7 protein [Cryptosporangiaceae bacterium]MDQ1674868.1 hypothetical protein [Actinomycetota bacterium]